MDGNLAALSGMIGGAILGAAIAYMIYHHTSPYGAWLGRTCWVRPVGRPEWREHVIVAVSWKGAVCVRDRAAMDSDGYWIKKQNVRWRLRWERPREGEQ